MEPIAYSVDSRVFTFGLPISHISNFILFIVAPIEGALIIEYVRYKTTGIFHLSIVKTICTFIPFWFTFVLLILNVFIPIYYRIDPITNMYEIGPVLYIHYVVLGFIMLYALYFVLKSTEKTKVEKWLLVVFLTIPTFGTIVHFIDFHITSSWSSLVLSVLVLFLFFEAEDIEKDYLTKLYNRRSFDLYMEYLLKKNKPFKLIYFDLDKFKNHNDTYGHLSGDELLKDFGRYLADTFHHEFMIARLGGDEFMVVVEHMINIEKAIDNLKRMLSSRNKNQEVIKFSYGIQENEDCLTIVDLYNKVDEKMYEFKKANKNLRRRITD
jgi:diguanylate cyclase (GGDEF)-like protein